MRCVHRTEREIQEERPVGAHRLQIADPADGLIDDVFTEVIRPSVGHRRRRFEVVIVAGEFRAELIALTLQESVVLVEPLLQRPVVVRPGSRSLLHRCKVPLACGVCGVAVCAQQLGDGCRTRRDPAAHVRVPAVPVGDPAHTHGVVVAARHQARPCG